MDHILNLQLSKKKAATNPKNGNDNCVKYAATTTLNFVEIKKDPQRVSHIKPFINNYKWERIN